MFRTYKVSVFPESARECEERNSEQDQKGKQMHPGTDIPDRGL